MSLAVLVISAGQELAIGLVGTLVKKPVPTCFPPKASGADER